MAEKPIHSIYTLFEEEPYISLIKKKINEIDETKVYKEILHELKRGIIHIKEEIKKVIIEAYAIYREDVEKNPLTESEKEELAKLDLEELKERLKDIEIKEEDKRKLTAGNIERLRELSVRFTELYRTYLEYKEAYDLLSAEKEKVESYKEVFTKLLDMLEAYPKHLRFGFLDDFELRALRYITDTYFTFFSQGIILGDLDALKTANFIILPFILNIQETSLSKEAFFLRLVHNAPLIAGVGVKKEEIKEEALKELYGLKTKEELEKIKNEINIR